MANHAGEIAKDTASKFEMTEFLPYLSTNKEGIFVGLAILFGMAFFVQWLLWMFAKGRFHEKPVVLDKDGKTRSSIRWVLTDLFAKVINDFRHLLALVIVMLFAVVLVYVVFTVQYYADAKKVDLIQKGLQAVTGSLGGIIGVILGYYFGESAAVGRKGKDDGSDDDGSDASEQGDGDENDGGPDDDGTDANEQGDGNDIGDGAPGVKPPAKKAIVNKKSVKKSAAKSSIRPAQLPPALK